MSLLQKASIITTPTAYAEDYLYSIKPAYALGSELVTNGNFYTNSDWILANATITNNQLVVTGGSNFLRQNGVAVIGKKYQVKVNIASQTSFIRLRITFSSSGFQNEFVPVVGDNIINVVADGTQFRLEADGAVYTGVINSVSLKEITDADFDFDRNSTGTRVNEDYLIEDVPYNLVDKSEEQEDWTIFAYGGASIIRTPNQQSPFYDNKAVLFDFTAGTGSNGILVTRNATVGANMNNTLSVWMKGVVGGEIVKVACRNTGSTGNDIGTVTITNQWKRYTFTIANNLSTTDRGFQFRFTSSDSVPTQSLFVYGAQIVKGDQPKDYLKTTDRLDIPRIDYTNGEPSIKLEPQRQNSYTYSQDFTQWGNARTTDTANQITSPDGLNNGTLLEQQSGQTNAGSIYIGSLGLSAGTYTQSIYAKKKDKNFIVGYDANAARTYFNLETGKVGTVASGVTAEIIAMPNDWYRCIITYTITTGSVIAFYLADSDNSTTVTDSGGIYIYGAQLEAGSYATSLIHTSGSAVTRSADVANNAGNSDLINSTEGVLYAEISALANDGTNRAISIGDGSTSNVVRFYYSVTDNRIVGNVKSGGSSVFNFNNVLINATDFIKLAIYYKVNDFKMYVNGTQVSSDTRDRKSVV